MRVYLYLLKVTVRVYLYLLKVTVLWGNAFTILSFV